MTNDLNDILNHDELTTNPFKVPEGYFNTLNDRLMKHTVCKGKEEKKNTGHKASIFHLHPLRWAAGIASVIIVGITASIYVNKDEDKDVANVSSIPTVMQQQNDALNQAADYTMLDNQDMYQYLAEE